MKPRHIGIFALAGTALLCAVGASAHAAGLYLNTTPSAPVGLWRVSSLAPDDARRGRLVSICPPALRIVEAMRVQGYLHPGNCDGTDTTPLLKPVVAAAGDTVTIDGAGISVNGRQLPNSRQQPQMPSYPSGSYEVSAGEVWIVSSYSAGSFDSRYFGPVSLRNLRGGAEPVAVIGDASTLTVREAAL